MGEQIALSKKCQKFCDRRSIIVIEENKRKFQGNNQYEKMFAQYRVDGCLIQRNKKCDFLLLNVNERIAYFIELKGKDILDATEQINCSIDILGSVLDGYVINARIVVSKTTPDIKSSQYIKLMNRIKKLKGTLLQRTNVLEENL